MVTGSAQEVKASLTSLVQFNCYVQVMEALGLTYPIFTCHAIDSGLYQEFNSNKK